MKIVDCFSCGRPDDLPRNVVSFRCKNCNKIQCLICSTSHDCACDLFRDNNVKMKPNSSLNSKSQSHRRFSNYHDDDNSGVSTRRVSKSSKFSKNAISRRHTVAGDHVYAQSSSTPISTKTKQSKRTYCFFCQEDYCQRYYNFVHKNTKKHRENYTAASFKLEKEEDSDATIIENSM